MYHYSSRPSIATLVREAQSQPCIRGCLLNTVLRMVLANVAVYCFTSKALYSCCVCQCSSCKPGHWSLNQLLVLHQCPTCIPRVDPVWITWWQTQGSIMLMSSTFPPFLCQLPFILIWLRLISMHATERRHRSHAGHIIWSAPWWCCCGSVLYADGLPAALQLHPTDMAVCLCF